MLQLEVGLLVTIVASVCFKPHQRGGGCCSNQVDNLRMVIGKRFQTPSAGRWVLQQSTEIINAITTTFVSNPISGEVGAAAGAKVPVFLTHGGVFQTPSAGRWVLQQR